MPEDMRLTWKEIQFLTECCMYNYEGGDLNSFSKLSNHLMGIKFFNKKSDCSVYKTKVANKKWIKSGRDLFKLPSDLDIKEDNNLEFSVNIKYVRSVDR